MVGPRIEPKTENLGPAMSHLSILAGYSLRIDKRTQQLKFENWDVNKSFETDAKVMGFEYWSIQIIFLLISI